MSAVHEGMRFVTVSCYLRGFESLPLHQASQKLRAVTLLFRAEARTLP